MVSPQFEGLGLRYLRVANSIRQRITEGGFRPGERLPRQHDLAREYGVAFGTLKRALDLLRVEGYVVSRAGQGTYAALPERNAPRALVVDDEESVRLFLERALARSGWECVAVESGSRALEKIAEQRFDVIFLDLVMPGLDGAATFREILKLDRKAKVLIITAYPETALMSEALDVGSFGLMKKPIDLEDLRRVLSDIAATAGGSRR